MSTVTPNFFKGADWRLISTILHGPRTQWSVWGGFARVDTSTGRVDASRPHPASVLTSRLLGREMLKSPRGQWTNVAARQQVIGQGEPVARNFRTEVFPTPTFRGN